MSLSPVPSPGNGSFIRPQVLLAELRKLRRRLPAARDDQKSSQERQTLLPILAGGNAPQLIEDFCSTWTTLQRWLGFFGAPKACSFLDVPIANQTVVESVEDWIRGSETGLLEFMSMYPGKCIQCVDWQKGESVVEDLVCNTPGHSGKLVRDAEKAIQNSSTKVMTTIMDDWVDLPAGQALSKIAKISKGVVIVHWKRNDLSGNDWEMINSDPDLDVTDEWTVVEG